MSRDEDIEIMARAFCGADCARVELPPCGGPCNNWTIFKPEAEAALTALEASGRTVVPVEPTPEMLDAYWSQTGESREMRERTHAYMRRYWAAMLAASADGKAFMQEGSAEAQSAVANPPPPMKGQKG